ncbi:MAG: neutral zinc metallopeptidase [Kutzneria sp.]|nr:neutral zinc metallopeptidase [Kutzneria sp.]
MNIESPRHAVTPLVIAVGLLAACSTPVAGKASPLGALDPGSVAGLAVTNGPSGPRAGAPDTGLTAEGSDGGQMDRLALNTISDVDDYWAEQLPKVFNTQFRPVDRLNSYDSDGPARELCETSTARLVNAFYCNVDNSVSWDRGELLPQLTQAFGPLSVTMVLAHEMGHAIQYQLGPASGVSKSTPSIVLEQQADCYAGGFFRYVAEGKAKHFEMSTGDGLNKVLATTFSVRDPAGGSFKDQTAHGSAFDRVYAFQAGFTDGPKRCAQINQSEITKRATESTFLTEKDRNQGGNEPINEKNLEVIEQALKDVFGKKLTTTPTFGASARACSDAQTTSPASYCPSTNMISLDVPKLTEIGTPPVRGQGTGIGDFAAFGEIVSRYALAVLKSANLSLTGTSAALQTACLVGAWGAAMKLPSGKKQPDSGKAALTAGDLDKAIAELLRDNSLIAADVDGKPAAAGFARVEALRIGYLQGMDTCTQQFS